MFFKKRREDDFGKRIVPHVPAIWRFALSLSGQPDVADDLTQATCLRAIEKQHQYQERGSLIGWLVTICRSIWLNELRAQSLRKTGGLETAKPSDLVDPANPVEMNIFAAQVFSKVMELPEAQRAAVDLVYVQQFTYSEAAHVLDVPIGTIMSRLHTARKALAELNADTSRDKGKKRS